MVAELALAEGSRHPACGAEHSIQDHGDQILVGGQHPLGVDRIWYLPVVKSRGRGSIVPAPGPAPFPSTPWQPAHQRSYVAFPAGDS